jgi:phosphate transport system substrate-binding protein
MNLSFKTSVTCVLGMAAMSFATFSAAQGVTGAGASFPAPLYSKWASDYNKATNIKINYQSVGSGAGIRQIEAKTVYFGASDAPYNCSLLTPIQSCSAVWTKYPAPPG